MSEPDAAAFHPLRMGLEPLPLADWLKPQAGDEALRALRKDLARTKADLVLALRSDARAAVAELADLLYARGFSGIKRGDDIATLASLAESVAEDVCILTPHGDSHLFTAGVLCFPNRWRLPEKIGKTLIETHAPVPDYASAVGATVDRFLARLRPMRPYTRTNWGLASVPELHLPEPVAPVNPATDLEFYLRIETQGFLKLPQTQAVIFSIRTAVAPWRDVPAGRRAAILDAVRQLNAPWLSYKSIRQDASSI